VQPSFNAIRRRAFRLHRVENIVACKGTGDGKAVLASALRQRRRGPGVSDDGAGVAAVIGLRGLPPGRPVTTSSFCLTDGEEPACARAHLPTAIP
jgi:hypothetical protein